MSTVVITGANRGLGLSFATLYKKQGWTVHALCRQASDQLNALIKQEIDESTLKTMDIDIENLFIEYCQLLNEKMNDNFSNCNCKFEFNRMDIIHKI